MLCNSDCKFSILIRCGFIVFMSAVFTNIYTYTYISLLELCYRTQTSFIIELDLKVTFLAKIITHRSKKKNLYKDVSTILHTQTAQGVIISVTISRLIQIFAFVDFYSK